MRRSRSSALSGARKRSKAVTQAAASRSIAGSAAVGMIARKPCSAATMGSKIGTVSIEREKCWNSSTSSDSSRFRPPDETAPSAWRGNRSGGARRQRRATQIRSIGSASGKSIIVPGVAIIAEHGGAEPVERAVRGRDEIDGVSRLHRHRSGHRLTTAASRQPRRVGQVDDAPGEMTATTCGRLAARSTRITSARRPAAMTPRSGEADRGGRRFRRSATTPFRAA